MNSTTVCYCISILMVAKILSKWIFFAHKYKTEGLWLILFENKLIWLTLSQKAWGRGSGGRNTGEKGEGSRGNNYHNLDLFEGRKWESEGSLQYKEEEEYGPVWEAGTLTLPLKSVVLIQISNNSTSPIRQINKPFPTPCGT